MIIGDIETTEKVEYEDLLKNYYEKMEIIEEQDKEIERLHSIINELNCGIKELDNMFYETFRISQNGYYSISEWELKEFTDKIKELKGSGSNE